MKKILTLIMDGFGISKDQNGNALKSAEMPNYKKLLEAYPHTELDASGVNIGLPEGQAGNDAVSYQTMAYGEVYKQRSSYVHDFVDIDSLATNAELKKAIDQVKKKKSTLHIIGLMSDGGVSSNLNDIIKIIEYLKTQKIKLGVDFIADGKDVEPKSALKYVEMIEATKVPIISLCGRYYAMDNENKWDRTRIYYDLIRNGVGLKIKEIPLALKNCYIRNITDEFLPPMLIKSDSNISDNDVVLWVNFKNDESTQILTSLTNPDKVTEFQTRDLNNTKVLVLYPIDSDINATVLIDAEEDKGETIGMYLSKLELSQARIATKESYELITKYFSGNDNGKITRCNNYLINETDENSIDALKINSAAITKQIIKSMEKDTDFILASFRSPLTVARSGDFNMTVEMLQFIDECLGKIIEGAELNFYTLILTSPYGNIESMINEENKAITVNTLNKVPLIIADTKIELIPGSLKDLAPTILSYMDIGIPDSMKDSQILIK